MAKPIIYIPVESKKREFDGKILLAKELIQRGFKVVLGTKSGVHREALNAQNGIYLAKSASNENLNLYKQLQHRGHRMAVLDVEGGALTREIANDLFRSYQPEASSFFDFFYVFGDKIKESIVEHLPYIKPDQVMVTGEPRFDLLRPEFDRFFGDEIHNIQQQYGNYILMNTSFGLSNSLLGEEGIRHFLENTTDIPDEQRPLYLLKHREGKILLREFVDLAAQIATTFPDHQLIIRPHPDEDPSPYMTLTASLNNVHVNGSGNVHPWIKLARMVIHHDCTTGMESVMAGKPTISFIPRMEESITAWLPIYLSIACKTPQEVLEAMQKIVTENQSDYEPGGEKQKVFSSHFINYTTHGSILLSEALEDAYGNINSSCKNTVRMWRQRAKSLLKIRIYRKKMREGSRERFMHISESEVRHKLLLLDSSLTHDRLNAKVRGGNTIHLERRDL
jgi:surface carbohydrate biosynthesis protein